MNPTEESAAATSAGRAAIGTTATTLGAGALWSYLCIVFLYQETIGGWWAGAAVTLLAIGTGVAGALGFTRRLLARRPHLAPNAVNLGLASAMLTATIMMADLTYGLFANWAAATQTALMDPAARQYDNHIWHGELYPREYYPTTRNFTLYKPNVLVAGESFGEFYHPDMLASPTLVDSVLELKSLSYHIGPLGVRESAPLADSHVFALGDSFAMGYGTDEGDTWTDLLGQARGEPVYNLGVSSTGPRSQLMLLEHLLETHRDSMRVEHLLWMIFEGNDLENSYATRRPDHTPTSDGGRLTEGTVLALVAAIPRTIKNSSIIRHALAGTLVRPPAASDGYTVDGVRLAFPLFHSERWGYRLFNPQDVERATKPAAYVLEHPNRPQLEETFRAMATLSRTHGFRVTVLIAPTAARMYGPSFDDFPAVSPEAHFIGFVATLARQTGFAAVDLLAEMQPYAQEDLLYYRDDHHWNRQGHRVAARVIEGALDPR